MKNVLVALSLAWLVAATTGCVGDDNDGESSEAAIERSRGTMTDDELRAFRETFQADYGARYTAARGMADAPAPACDDAKRVLDYVDALIASDRIEEANTFAAGCLRRVGVAVRKAEHYLAAARAARFSLDLAAALRHAASAAEIARGRAATVVALERAELLAVSQDFDVKRSIDDVLAQGRLGSATTTSLVSNVVTEALAVQPFEITEERERDLNRVIDAMEEPAAAAWVLYYMAHASIASEYRYHDTLKMLGSRRGRALVRSLPAAWLTHVGRIVHRAVMNHNHSRFGWTQGKQLLEGLAPFQRKDQMLFSLAMGPYNYEELQDNACKTAYAKGADRTLLTTAQKGFLDGTLTAHAALTQIAPLRRTGDAALVDVEVFAGTMLESKGNDRDALEAFWTARKVCPYYGRAMSGTFGVMSRLTNAAKPRALQTELPGRPPTAIKQYVLNYDTLSPAQQKDTAYGLSFWWPYLGTFAQSGRILYVAPTYQRLVETPPHRRNTEYATDRGANDGRLTDDLDGIGGDQIVVSFGKLADYKGGTIVHEAAHQFHYAATAPVKSCIQRLYNDAKARNDFCVGYAATNEFEYFGVGIQHYTSPDGFVGYGGITKAWYVEHDPKLLALMDSIAASSGDMSRIVCPP